MRGNTSCSINIKELERRFKMNKSKSSLSLGLTALAIDNDQACPKRQRKLTEKGLEYQIELLKCNRSATHAKLLFYIKKIKGLLNNGANIEELGQAKDELDHRMESFVEVHGKYDFLLSSTEDRTHSYQWFEARNRVRTM